jgi:PAS domain S-box-containing protein
MKDSLRYLSYFFSRNGERQEIAEIRKTILNNLLYIFSLLGLPAVGIGATQAFQQGRWLFSLIYIVIYLLFLLATFATRRLPYTVRGLILVSCMFVLALAIMLRIGMSGVGFQIMLGVCFLSAFLFGLRGGMLAILVTLVSIGLVAAGMTTGFIRIYPEQMLTSLSPLAWITALVVFFMIVSVTVMVPQLLSRRIEESLDLLEKNKRELEAANKQLKEASLIISKSRAVAFLWCVREGWPVEYVSDNLENVLGYTAGEFLTGRIVYSSVIHPEDLPRVTQEVSRYSGEPGREGFTHEPYRIIRKDGKIRWVEDTTSIRRDSTGKITHFQGIVQDITERKRSEEERRNLETRLQRAQKMEAIGLTAGGVAHDLNNTLSAIVSLPELILMDIPAENKKLRNWLQIMMSAGQRTAAIVDDLLTITRGVSMTRVALNLNTVVQEYIGTPEFEKLKQFHPGVEVVTQLADDLLPIKGSRTHLMKALMNLVSNASEAFQYSDSGVVSISTQNLYVDSPLEGYDRVNTGEYNLLVIQDNGMGISPEDRERIFEPFYTKKVMGRSGTGLGLSVVWNTVVGHEGYILVKSGDGGTVFELYFPITREGVLEEEKPIDQKQFKGKGEKVLVVDDEPDQRVIAVEMLNKLGYQAVAVSGGREAVEFLKEQQVDVLLLDMLMPDLDGCDTFSQIVQLRPGQKAVIASGFSPSERVKKAQELGAGAFIKKPYSVEKLGLAIRTELDRSL